MFSKFKCSGVSNSFNNFERLTHSKTSEPPSLHTQSRNSLYQRKKLSGLFSRAFKLVKKCLALLQYFTKIGLL